jgi:arabinose-5-phosphate isomerase
MKTNDDIPIANANTKLLDALLIMSQKALGMVLITKLDYFYQRLATSLD